VDPKELKWNDVIPATHMGRMIGNSIPVNLMERILARALWASGLVSRRITDPYNVAKKRTHTLKRKRSCSIPREKKMKVASQ
jgi:hypothetical protein